MPMLCGIRFVEALVVIFLSHVHNAVGDLPPSMERYAPKNCKYNLLPSDVNTRAFRSYTGEVHVHDVFGMPATVKRHMLRLEVPKPSLLTLSAELHRDTPATLNINVYRSGSTYAPPTLVLLGRTSVGAGGDDMKAFVHGQLGTKSYDVVFELAAVEVSSAQVDSRVAEAKCLPIRLDLAVIPVSRAALNWPSSCPQQSFLPNDFQNQIQVLGDNGISLAPRPVDANPGHYTFRLSDVADRSSQTDFSVAVWSITLEVPQRLHRFARIFFRSSFRFASGPLQLTLELFDLKDTPDGVALSPVCRMGCLGGVPVHNGQVMDHAMPTGFRYKIWLLATDMLEWVKAIPGQGRRCLDFDLDYSISYETRMTPFEVGPSAWLCEGATLPHRLVQTNGSPLSAHSAHKNRDNDETIVVGRSIWLRDRFAFPPDEVSDMQHEIVIELTEPCLFRATTHHSEGVDVFIALTQESTARDSERICRVVSHPGPVRRQTIFCRLEPGTYVLTFHAQYPLGGMHPCNDFFAQVSLRPVALASNADNAQCVATAGDLDHVAVPQSLGSIIQPRWKAIKVPVNFLATSVTVPVWHQTIEVAPEDVMHQLFLRLVVHSDYATTDLRFQVKYRGQYVANTQVTAQGYADMLGPLDAGTYTVEMYYIAPSVAQKSQLTEARSPLCSTSFVDFRLVSQAAYANYSAMWLCTASRVPPPDTLAPTADEQVLLDSEYVIPNAGYHSMKLQVSEDRVLKVWMDSPYADFEIDVRSGSQAVLASSTNSLEVLLAPGTWNLGFRALLRGNGKGACLTMVLHLLLQPLASIARCPWSSWQSEYGADQDAVAQVSAADHIGQLKLDLTPKDLSKEVTAKDSAVHLWMSPGMEKSFDMSLSQTSSVRIEVMMQPPFLPLEITVSRKRSTGRLEPPAAKSDWVENRLLLMQSELARGDYVLTFQQPRKYKATESGGESKLDGYCAHLTIFAEVGMSSKDAVNSMRSELLQLPDVLAVQPFPPNFNLVGWHSSSLSPTLGTSVYRFPAGSGGATAPLVLTERAIVRVVCEPADLSNANASFTIEKGGTSVAVSDKLGALAVELEAGSYNFVFKPFEDAPYLMTLGIASLSRVKEDLLTEDSGGVCASTVPALNQEPRIDGWEIGPTNVRLASSMITREGGLSKATIVVATPSILYIEAGSALPIDLIRISLEVPEGLWIGEQRGMRNSLQIEVPPGTFTLNIGQPLPAAADINRCLDFSIYVRCMSLAPLPKDGPLAGSLASQTSAEGQGEELDANQQAVVQPNECFSTGALPLPLDLNTKQGGSAVLGGPLDSNGRLLIRSRVLITDMHDGRKKFYISTRSRKSLLKVGVNLGTHAHLTLASQLSFSATTASSKAVLEPEEIWTTDQGWERIFVLDGSSNYWLAFHHTHQESGETACMHFGLVLEVRPYEDMYGLINCNGERVSPDGFLPTSLDVDLSNRDTPYKFSKPMVNIAQPPRGFLREISFELKQSAFVNVSLPHSFLTSHAEMDIIRPGTDKTSLVFSELDFMNSTDTALTVRQFVSRVLLPGKYVIRVADDHYARQFGSLSEACFPFAFEFTAQAVVQPPLPPGPPDGGATVVAGASPEAGVSASVGTSGVINGASSGTVTAPSPGDSGGGGGMVGAIRAEKKDTAIPGEVQIGAVDSTARAAPSRPANAGFSVGTVRMEKSVSGSPDTFTGPVITNWRPDTPRQPPPAQPVQSSVTSRSMPEPAGCPDGAVVNVATGICERGDSMWPFGFRTVILACGASVLGLSLLANRGWLSSKTGQARRAGAARFRDVGARTVEEEIGLVARIDEEDDML